MDFSAVAPHIDHMPKVLVLFAHPALQRSKIHLPMMEAVRTLPDVTFHDLYEEYPDFHINEPREHELLESHDIIVFQHPLYWYTCPALLTEWIDLVLSPGWAFGPGGDKLKGKTLLSAITAGVGGEFYRDSDYDKRYPVSYFLLPFEQIAFQCGMTYLQPLVFKTTRTATDEDVAAHAETYKNMIVALTRGETFPPFECDIKPKF